MKAYLDLLDDVYQNGIVKSDRTGVGTISCFGKVFEHDLGEGFPLLTTKKLHFKSIAEELFWFLSMRSNCTGANVKDLQARGVTIWDEWADPVTGNLGFIYGCQWRSWMTGAKRVETDILGNIVTKQHQMIDQINNLINDLERTPDSRRLIVTAWNPTFVENNGGVGLPPCHILFQCYVDNDDRLSLQMYQRSADIFLGVPYNIASYALLVHLLCDITGLIPGVLRICFGDIHIYSNHVEQVKTQLKREPRKLPTLNIGNRFDEISHYGFHDLILEGYDDVWPNIKAPVAI